jgi:hypothetical protein
MDLALGLLCFGFCFYLLLSMANEFLQHLLILTAPPRWLSRIVGTTVGVMFLN